MSGPGSRLYVLAGYIFSPATIARLIDPWLADLRFEYRAAGVGRARAAWIRIVHGVAFARLVAVGVLAADTASTTRLIAWIVACTSLTTLAFTSPLQAQWAGRPRIYAREPSERTE